MNSFSILPYIKIARIDHWFKNVFMIPGIAIALLLDSELLDDDKLLFRIILAFLITGFIASSNYVINEILDAKKDKMHPVKRFRPIPSGMVNIKIAYAQWLILAIIGLALALMLSMPFFYSALALWIMGCVYNIPPVRSKEKPYIDVLSESVNNPLRLLLGWYATGTVLVLPVSLAISYWMLGAFFMAAKRLAEYKMIGDPERAAAYRESFRHYNSERLIISIVFYITAFGLFLGIFLIRYKMELILGIPLLSGFIAWYMKLSFDENSPVQYPEKLYKQSAFMVYTAMCAVLFLILLFVEFQWLHQLFTPSIGN